MNLENAKSPNLEELVYFYHDIYETYESKDIVDSLVEVFKLIDQKISFFDNTQFFIELFNLGIANLSDEEESNLFIMNPSLFLHQLYTVNYPISKIIGGILQIDHEDHYAFHLTQIIESLLEISSFSLGDLIAVLKEMITQEYANLQKFGRFLGHLLNNLILALDQILEIAFLIILEGALKIDQIAEMIIGLKSGELKSHEILQIIENLLAFEIRELSPDSTDYIIDDQTRGLARILAFDFHQNNPVNFIYWYMIDHNYVHILSKALRFLHEEFALPQNRIFQSVISSIEEREKYTYGIITPLISPLYSYHEISEIFCVIVKEINIFSEELIDQLIFGFYNPQFHGLLLEDLYKILDKVRKICPELFEKFKISDLRKYLAKNYMKYSREYTNLE